MKDEELAALRSQLSACQRERKELTQAWDDLRSEGCLTFDRCDGEKNVYWPMKPMNVRQVVRTLRMIWQSEKRRAEAAEQQLAAEKLAREHKADEVRDLQQQRTELLQQLQQMRKALEELFAVYEEDGDGISSDVRKIQHTQGMGYRTRPAGEGRAIVMTYEEVSLLAEREFRKSSKLLRERINACVRHCPCGEWFYARNSQIYCSPDCAREAGKIAKLEWWHRNRGAA